MKANRGRDTGPERRLRRLLLDAGFRGYRLNWLGAPGRPDVAFVSRRVAIFVHGCFWHRCPHCASPLPKANRAFWRLKFRLNQRRDARKRATLEAAGWAVFEVWECELARRSTLPKRIMLAVANSRPTAKLHESGSRRTGR